MTTPIEVQVDEVNFAAGPAISICEEEVLRRWAPNWPTTQPADVIENFMFDERSPRVFKVTPPASDNCYVEFSYVRIPAKVTSEATALELGDSYANAILFFMLMRAAEKAGKGDKAQWYKAQYRDALNLRTATDQGGSPNVRNQGGAGIGPGAR